jgi:hypothetical protein
MPDNDAFVAAGVIVTAALSLLNFAYTLRHNRRASYVASVTATRMKWIDAVREKLARFVAVNEALGSDPPNDVEEHRRLTVERAELRLALRLHLAPSAAELDGEFERRVNAVCAPRLSPAERRAKLDALVAFAQDFLWNEWMKVKRETIHGDPYDSVSRRLAAWIAPKRRRPRRRLAA